MGFFNRFDEEKKERDRRHKRRPWKIVENPGPQFHLTRKWFTDKATVGELTLDGELLCHTLEDTVRDPNKDGLLQKEEKVWGKTAIPAGRYEVVVNFSNKFQKYLPMLLNVPLFRGIRIHPGNKPPDTLGCILVGRFDKQTPDWVADSRTTFSKVFPRLEETLKKSKLHLDVMGGPRYEKPVEVASRAV